MQRTNYMQSLLMASLILFGCSTNESTMVIDSGLIGDGFISNDAAQPDAPQPDAAQPDAGIDICQPTPLDNNFPQPTIVTPGTACAEDQDCVAIGGFCRPIAQGGSECVAFQGIGEACGGLPAPSEQERCVDGLICESVDNFTVGSCSCSPQCEGKICGPDGCGGSCGSCDGVCASGGQICNDFEGDQCCNPILVDTLPFEHTGSTAGAENSFTYPAGPDEIIQFTPPISGSYYIWGGKTCEFRAAYENCGSLSSPFAMTGASCETASSRDREFRLSLLAGENYFIATAPSFAATYTTRIHGPIVTIADNLGAVAEIAVDATHVYWASGNTIFRRPMDGSGAPTAIMVSANDLVAFELRDDKIYGLDRINGLLLEGLKTGGAPTVLASQQTRVRAFTVSDSHVYWSTAQSDGFLSGCNVALDNAIHRVLRGGGTIENVALGQEIVTDLTSDDTHVYWSLRRHENFGPPPGGCSGPGIRRRSHIGGVVEAIPGQGQLNHIGIFVTDSDIYAASGPDDGDDTQSYQWHRYDKATLAILHSFPPILGIVATHDGTDFYAMALDQDDGGSVAVISETDPYVALTPPTYPGGNMFAISEQFVIIKYANQIVAVPKT